MALIYDAILTAGLVYVLVGMPENWLTKFMDENVVLSVVIFFVLALLALPIYILAIDKIDKIIEVLTHEELEAKCRQYICIKTDTVPMALTVLDKTMNNPEYKVVSDNTIHLYSDLNSMETIARTFMQNGIVVTELSVMEQTLEDYFMTITGGVSHV